MAADPAESPSRALAERAPERRRWLATGQGQGVGFRPFVYSLAPGHGPDDGRGVVIEAEGTPEHLSRFDRQLRSQPPPLARVDRLMGVGAATCPDRLREPLDPADRRHGHALITRIHCGPRYKIVRGVSCRFHTQQGRS